MTVYRGDRRRTYQYDFWYGGRRYKGNTYQETEDDAKLVEAKIKLRLRQERGGIAEPLPAPSITEWAGVVYTHLQKLQRRTGRPKRLDRIDEELRVVLRFWGKRPADPASPLQPREGEEAPFHDLTLQDPIDEPSWLLEFDEWMDRRGVAGGTRNHYLTTMSRIYTVAMLPEYRKTTGIATNPFAGRPRDRRVPRKVALTPELVLRWIEAMSYHTRLAVAIAALAPKLRLRNILALERAHIDPQVTRITVYEHKSDLVTGEPLVVPVTAQLRAILLHAFDQMAPGCRTLVQYHGKAVESIRGGLTAAARDAGIPYGRFTAGGVTFHTLRHTASTLFARLGVNPWFGRDAMGHQDLSTTEGYTHLQLDDQRGALEQLSEALPIAAAVTARQRRAVRLKPASAAGGRVGNTLDGAIEISQEKRAVTRGARLVPGRPFRRNSLENPPRSDDGAAS